MKASGSEANGEGTLGLAVDSDRGGVEPVLRLPAPPPQLKPCWTIRKGDRIVFDGEMGLEVTVERSVPTGLYSVEIEVSGSRYSKKDWEVR